MRTSTVDNNHPCTEQQGHYAIVARAIEFIRANAQRQPSLGDISAAVNLSESHLQRVFAAWAGISPKRFLQFLTKEHAIRSLQQSTDILSVALATGLSGPGRLHDLLVTCEAMTPGEIKSRGQGVSIGYGVAETPFGDALFGWTSRGVCYLSFCDNQQARQSELLTQWPEATLVRNQEQAAQLSCQIFGDQPKPGKLHLLLRGTNFQIKVWQALLNTEPSQIISYGQLAALAGSPKAQRAVGSALAANTIGYLIPCHRVIRGSGELGDIFRWGKHRKMAMQVWEAGLVQGK